MLKIRNLEAGYGNLRVLKGVSMHVNPGEIVAIIGANGAGKSTLLSTVAGLLMPSRGELEFEGEEVGGVPASRMIFKGCALVPEGRQLFAGMTVQENLILGAYCQYRRRNAEVVPGDQERMYELFPILRDRAEQLAGTLSGGEQQMLAIARALMARPRLLMLDEPSMGLAPRIVQDIFRIIGQLRDQGNTVMLVEQNARAALALADRGYVLETGQVTLSGAAEDLLCNNDVQRAYLGKDYRRIDESFSERETGR